MNADRKLELAAGGATVVLTVAAFGLSYAHLATVAHTYGMGTVAGWVWPGTIDTFIAIGELLVLRAALRDQRDVFAYFLTVVGSLGSVALNVAGVGSGMPVMNYVVAAVPPVAALLAFAALMRGVHGRLVDTVDTVDTGIVRVDTPASTDAEAVDSWTPPQIGPASVDTGVSTAKTQVSVVDTSMDTRVVDTVDASMDAVDTAPASVDAPHVHASTPLVHVDARHRVHATRADTRGRVSVSVDGKLSDDDADAVIREGWEKGNAIRPTADEATRSRGFVHKRYQELSASKEK